MKLLLVRHGESIWNEGRRFQGSTDVPLSSRGEAQAEALASRMGKSFPVAEIYASPLLRAQQTAQALARASGLPVQTLQGLREIGLGEWEGLPVDEVMSRYGEGYWRWLSRPLDCPAPGSEPLPDFARRVAAALQEVTTRANSDGDVVVVGHGGVISAFLCQVLGMELNGLWRFRIDNASLTTISFGPVGPRLLALNDTSHLSLAGEGRPVAP